MQSNHRFVVQKCREMCPEGKILDYGCGAGEIVEAGLDDGMDIHGVEMFYEGGNRRQAVLDKGLLGTSIKELEGGTIPHPDNTFDLVVSNQVFEHVPDLQSVLQEIRRVLKPNGKLLCLFPSKDVVREGHCGVPMVHWVSPRFNLRYYWLVVFRALGLGYHKQSKTVRQWSRDFVDYLERFTFYRSYAEIQQTFLQTFGSFSRVEQDYIAFRLQEQRRSKLSRLFGRAPLSLFSRLACRKLAGLVIVTSR